MEIMVLPLLWLLLAEAEQERVREENFIIGFEVCWWLQARNLANVIRMHWDAQWDFLHTFCFAAKQKVWKKFHCAGNLATIY